MIAEKICYGQVLVAGNGAFPKCYKKIDGKYFMARSPDGCAMPEGQDESGNRIWKEVFFSVPPRVMEILGKPE